MIRPIVLAIAALAVALTALPAAAKKRSIFLPYTSLQPMGIAVNAAGGTFLANSGSPGIAANFRLPADYASNTVVQFRLLGSSNGDCAVVLDVDDSQRIRQGFVTHESDERITPGLTTVTIPSAHVAVRKTFEIRGPLTATFSGQKPGDTFILQIFRQPGAVEDTCINDFKILGAEVRYTVAQ